MGGDFMLSQMDDADRAGYEYSLEAVDECPYCGHVHLYSDRCGMRISTSLAGSRAHYNCACEYRHKE